MKQMVNKLWFLDEIETKSVKKGKKAAKKEEIRKAYR